MLTRRAEGGGTGYCRLLILQTAAVFANAEFELRSPRKNCREVSLVATSSGVVTSTGAVLFESTRTVQELIDLGYLRQVGRRR